MTCPQSVPAEGQSLVSTWDTRVRCRVRLQGPLGVEGIVSTHWQEQKPGVEETGDRKKAEEAEAGMGPSEGAWCQEECGNKSKESEGSGESEEGDSALVLVVDSKEGKSTIVLYCCVFLIKWNKKERLGYEERELANKYVEKRKRSSILVSQDAN